MDYPPPVDDYATRLRSHSTGNVPGGFYATDFPAQDGQPAAAAASPGDFSNMPQIGKMIWDVGSQQVKDSFVAYGRIDHFRPYFDVEPHQVRNRLIQSFLPRRPSQISVTHDLYGPTMVVLTMVALLLYNMKLSGYTAQNGTLMGTALVSCFAAWLFFSSALYTICFLLSTDVPLVNMFSLFGYSMTSHCVVLLLTSLFHPAHDHLFFLLLLVIFCLPSSLRMCFYLIARTRERAYKATLTAAVLAIHLLYVCYLHFGFHVVVEELDEILGDTPVGNVPLKLLPPETAAAAL